jgi:hypothetical protein
MICTFVGHKVLRKLEKRQSVARADIGEQNGEHTYLKDIRDHKLVFVCTVCHKASENKSTNESSVRKSGVLLSDIPSHTPPDTSGENSAIRMAPYTVGKVPSMAFCIVDDYSAADTLANTLGYKNVRRTRSKGGYTGVGI